MGLIKNYTNNLVLEASDKLIGSAGEEGSTKNFTLGDIADFIYSYKYNVYTATIKANNSGGAPSATVLDNTVGAIVWTRTSTGIYTGTLAGAFADNSKLWFSANTTSPTIGEISIYPSTANTVIIDKIDNADGLDCSIEIRIYN